MDTANLALSGLELMEGVEDIHSEYFKVREKRSNLSVSQREEVMCRKQLYDFYSNPYAVVKEGERCHSCQYFGLFKAVQEKRIIPSRTRTAPCGICDDFEIIKVGFDGEA